MAHIQDSFRLICLTIIILTAVGCSGAKENPAVPGDDPDVNLPVLKHSANSGTRHFLWGLWQFVGDPKKHTFDVIQLRAAKFHQNVLPYLEPEPLKFLTLESFTFYDYRVEADIGLTHPLAGLTEFTGFDVRGIVITNGFFTQYGDDLVMAGWNDVRLLNPDGYTRWWNPAEFPHAPVFGYTDGLLGTPDSKVNYICNVNAYKYYADCLGPTDNVSSIPEASRGVFSPGKKNVRHYVIEFGGEPLIFNYAVDASWEFPTGNPPWSAPEDFPESANCAEVYRIDVDLLDNSLYYEDYPPSGGGTATLSVTLHDWFNPGLNSLEFRSLCGFPSTIVETPSEVGDGYAKFQVGLDGSNLTGNGLTDFMFICGSEQTGYQGLLPGEPVCSYFTKTIDIPDPTPGKGWVWFVNHEIDKSDFAIAASIAPDSSGGVYITGSAAGSYNSDACLARVDANGNSLWLLRWGVNQLLVNEAGRDVAVDSSGYVYVVGTFDSTIDFDPGPGVDERSTNGYTDLYLSKFLPNGDFVWTRTWGGEFADYCYAMAIDDSNAIYIVGVLTDTADCDPGPGVDIHESGGTFLTKLDMNGYGIWTRTWGDHGWDKPYALALDKQGSVYVVGSFYSTVDFDPGPGTAIYTSNGDQDIFGSMFSSSGNWMGTITLGGLKNDVCSAITVSKSGAIYVAGYFRDTVDFDPGPGEDNHTIIGIYPDIFLGKYAPNGKLIWVKTWDATVEIEGHPIKTDDSGNIYITGHFQETIDFDPGPGTIILTSKGSNDIFFSKFDLTGNLLWVRNLGNMGSDSGYAALVDNSGNPYFSGIFRDIVDFDPGPDSYYCAGNYTGSPFVVKLLPDGYL